MAHGVMDEKHARDYHAARLFDLHGSEMAFNDGYLVEILQAAVSSYTPERVASPSMLPKYARKSSLTILSQPCGVGEINIHTRPVELQRQSRT